MQPSAQVIRGRDARPCLRSRTRSLTTSSPAPYACRRESGACGPAGLIGRALAARGCVADLRSLGHRDNDEARQSESRGVLPDWPGALPNTERRVGARSCRHSVRPVSSFGTPTAAQSRLDGRVSAPDRRLRTRVGPAGRRRAVRLTSGGMRQYVKDGSDGLFGCLREESCQAVGDVSDAGWA